MNAFFRIYKFYPFVNRCTMCKFDTIGIMILLLAFIQGPPIKCPHFKNMITSKPVSVGNPNVLITLLDILSFVG